MTYWWITPLPTQRRLLPLELLQHVFVELQREHRIAWRQGLRHIGDVQQPQRIGDVEIERIDIFVFRLGIALLVEIGVCRQHARRFFEDERDIVILFG
jgi:hypothetical protein